MFLVEVVQHLGAQSQPGNYQEHYTAINGNAVTGAVFVFFVFLVILVAREPMDKVRDDISLAGVRCKH